MHKRLLSILLVMLMLISSISMIPITASAAENNTLTIDIDSFSPTNNQYGWHPWSISDGSGGTISGSGFIYGQTTNSIQMNGDKAGDYIYNTSALPGGITSIKLTQASGTSRAFAVFTSETPFNSGTAAKLQSQATAADKQTISTAGVTWNFNTNHKYFAIVNTTTKAAYLSSIEITYSTSSASTCTHENKVAIGEPKDATCTEEGITAGEKCADCGTTVTAQQTISAAGHTDTDDNGICDICDESTCEHKDTVAIGEAKDATCTENGITAGVKCADCDKVITEQEDIPATGHNYVDGKCSVCETPQNTTVSGTQLAEFQFGDNGDASHKDGSTIDEDAAYTDGDYKLTLTGVAKVYDSAFDAKGNSALKLGTSSAAATFTFNVDDNVKTVVMYIAGYKANPAKIDVNGTNYEITSKSDEGAYTKIVVDTTTTKEVTLNTLNGGYRAMVDSIAFYGTASTTPIEDKINGYTVTLGDNIGVNFYMDLTETTLADDTAYMQFTLPDGSTSKVSVADVKTNNGAYYFTANVAVKEMADDIKAQLITAAGKSEEYTHTVKDYAEYIISRPGDYTANEIALAKALLNYGGYAQIMFAHNPSAAANNGLSQTDRDLGDVSISNTYAKQVTDNITGATYLGTSTMWEADTAIRHYFTITGENITFKLYDANDQFLKDLAVETNDNGKCVVIDGIVAKDMKTTYKLVVSNGTDEQTITYSVYSYFYDILAGDYTVAQKNAIKAAYRYAEAAATYLATR